MTANGVVSRQGVNKSDISRMLGNSGAHGGEKNTQQREYRGVVFTDAFERRLTPIAESDGHGSPSVRAELLHVN